jgi:hypothetical protein
MAGETGVAVDAPHDDPQTTKLRLEVEHLQRENEKLSLELDDLRGEGALTKRVKALLPLVTGLLAVAGFWFGIIQYIRAEDASRQQRQAAEEARRQQQEKADEAFRSELTRETARPLWDRQLGLYLEAAEKAATIATTDDKGARKAAEARFWVLYWGPLAAVEDVGLGEQKQAEIEAAMVRFGRELDKKPEERKADEMKQMSLQLAQAIRKAIAPAFQVKAAELAGLRTATPKPSK